MVGYVTIGSNDFERAGKFYDQLLGVMGASRMMDTDGFIAWASAKEGACALSIAKPFDGKPATVGNGVMVALAAESKEQVTELYEKAMELGAKDEGAPGPRGDGFYAGYFRDPDGNKLNAFFMG